MLFALAGVISPAISSAAPVPVDPGFEVELIASGLDRPTSMAFAPDGRIFVTEKSGRVRVIKNGALLPTPFIQLTDVNIYGDRGLHGIALDPEFSQNGYVYLLYTHENTPGVGLTAPKTGRLARVTAAGALSRERPSAIRLREGRYPGSGTTMKVRVRLQNGSFVYPLLGLLVPSTDWRRAEFQFVAPSDAVAVSIFHYLDDVGFLETDQFSLRRMP